MNPKLFILFLALLFLVGSVSAVDLSWSNFGVIGVPIEGSDVNFIADLYSSGSFTDNTMGTIFLNVDGVNVSTQPFSLNGGDVLSLNMRWDNNVSPVSRGTHAVTFGLSSLVPLDDNAFNNSIGSDVNVLGKPDLLVLSLTPSTNSPNNGTPFSLIGVIRNNGQSASMSSTAQLFLGSTLITSRLIPIMSAGGDFVFQHDWNISISGSQEIRLVVDSNNVVSESNENNNQSSVFLSNASEVDLSVIQSDVSVIPTNPELYTNASYAVIVRNLGVSTQQSFTVKVFLNVENPSNLIGTHIVNGLSSGSSTMLNGSFQTTLTGSQRLIVRVDSTNIVTELSENNNSVEQTFAVGTPQNNPTPDLNAFAYPLFFDISQECHSFLSNSDHFQVTQIDENGLNFYWFDSNGTIIDSGNGVQGGYERVLNGIRTLRVLSVDNGFAHIVLVYRQPTQVTFNSCLMDINASQTENQLLKKQLGELNYDLSRTIGESSACNTLLTSYKADLDSLRSNNSVLTDQLSDSSKIIQNNDSICQTKITGLQETFQANTTNQLQQKDIEVQDIKTTASLSSLFFVAMIIMAGFIVLTPIIVEIKNRKRIEK